ncbi:hypothetical protein TRFO_14487 [Tritrichomonas foetus]|uniref:Leucine Rich Repeat family protein n=1 Tax=Tritrichomonas foetus TaxID=1144522 RepID=A0A1J4KZK7_9EUKA|nr:hypothetical protein TRFO_14487 [Tritrichomonas foetus]|eukprot:OHT15124.1 hypothetical protein TRFO_14487 [Tritrichomonas foetus]
MSTLGRSAVSFADSRTLMPMYTPHYTFAGQDLTSFPPANALSSYASLSFENNPIYSLEGLESLFNLKSLNLSGTEIESFQGVCVQPNIERIYIKNTPLSQLHNVRIMCMIAFGPTLQAVDNSPLTTFENKIGKFLFNQMNPYLKDGWIIIGLYPLKILHLPTGTKQTLKTQLPITIVKHEKGPSYYESSNFRFPASPADYFSDFSSSSIFSKSKSVKSSRLGKRIANDDASVYSNKKSERSSKAGTPVKKSNINETDTPRKKKRMRSPKKKAKNTSNLVDVEFDDSASYHSNHAANKTVKGNPNAIKPFFEQLKNIRPLKRPNDFMMNDFPLSDMSSSASFDSFGRDFISDSALDRQLSDMASRISDLDISGSDLNGFEFKNSGIKYHDSVEDFLPSKQRKKAKLRRTLTRSRSSNIMPDNNSTAGFNINSRRRADVISDNDQQ